MVPRYVYLKLRNIMSWMPYVVEAGRVVDASSKILSIYLSIAFAVPEY